MKFDLATRLCRLFSARPSARTARGCHSLEILETRIAPAAFGPVVELSGLDGNTGFKLSGVDFLDRSGSSVSGAGDVNGDGIDDLIVGAFQSSPNGRYSGASYVVFGSPAGFVPNLNLSGLTGANGFKLSGVESYDYSGWSVSGAGDINGDGIDDLIVGAVGVDPNGSGSGASYVVFGSRGGFPANLNLSSLTGTNGFKLSGVEANDDSGRSVSAAGDINGDGIDDLIVGAYGARPNGAHSGASYVVFGNREGFAANVNLSSLTGINGFKLSGVAADDTSGISVSGVGDINGDGIDDLIVGASGSDPNGLSSGASYVVFGSRAGFAADVNLSSLTGANGFKLSGVAAFDSSGFSVSGAGDINGDGIDDLIVGALGADANGSGASYVVFGSRAGFAANVNLSSLTGANGLKLSGVAAFDSSGASVSGAGDINGDGIDDLIVGAPSASPNGVGSGASYVVFGSRAGFAADVNLSSLTGANGFKLNGAAERNYAGRSVSGAGDLNGDGIDDLIVGAPGNSLGSSYVVFGRPEDPGFAFSADLPLSTLTGPNGFKLSGVAAGDKSGFSVSPAGDINGDGIDDVIIGADFADPNGANSGASYVVFGSPAGFPANVNLSSLTGTNGFTLSGVAALDHAGASVSGAGDINGDGIGDLIVGARYADPNGANSGASYVVFGSRAAFAADLDLSSLTGTNGFKLSGAAGGDNFGVSVSGAGDINDDGIDDLIVGAFYADANGANSGASYVVFGSRAAFAADLDLSSLTGTNGFKLSGAAGGDLSGFSVSAAGDINGDGIDDLIVGAFGADYSYYGASYVVFGSRAGFAANVDLSSLTGTNGFKLSGVWTSDESGFSVSGAGDVNGDGIDDLIVGAPTADPNFSGASYVVFGSSAGFPANVNLSSLTGTNGFKLSGLAAGDYCGNSVSGAGDINGDGIDDVIVGARRADPNGTDSGASYVVFGSRAGFAANVNLSSLTGANGFKLSGVAADDFSGWSVSGAGDINGDGIDDLIVGAYLASANGYASGASYVVFGHRGPAAPVVSSIAHAGAATLTGASATWTVTFSTEVTGVGADDFGILTTGGAKAGAISVTGTGSVYTVTVNGLQGSGEVQLNLIDNDTITNGTLLGGAGVANGSFQGDAIRLLQIFPKVSAISAIGSTTTSASSVSWTVTLSAPVTGVDATDFILIKEPGVTAEPAVTVAPVSSTEYTVTATGVGGAGTLALQLVDNGTIHDADGKPLQGTPPPAFATQVIVPAGSAPRSVAVADLNADGLPDLVVANEASNNVSVFLGRGTGGYVTKTNFLAGISPRSVAVGDVNGDGKPDLITANFSSDTVSVLLGDGIGGFAAKTDFATGSGPASVAVGDVNGDGMSDLIVGIYAGSGLDVLLGAGNGIFSARLFAGGGISPTSVAVSDFNEDGKLDIVATNFRGSNVSMFLGNGSGSFAPGVDFQTFGNPNTVAVGDVNGDGRPDLAVTYSNTNKVSLLLGDGSGGFSPKTDFFTGTTPRSVALGDVNRDGNLDLVVANFDSNTVSVLLGDGSGGFSPKSDFGTGNMPFSVAVADVNGDGKPDIVTANSGSNNLSVLLGAGVGTFTGDTFTILPSVSIAVSPAAVLEGSSTGLTYTFTRTGDASSALAINFTTSGNATFANDFTVSTSGTLDFANGTLTIPTGSASVTVTLAPVDDQIVEGNEEVTLSVAAGDSYVATGSPATGTITDNDTAALSFVTGTSAPIENSGTHNVGVQLVITGNGVAGAGTLGKAVSVNLEDLLSGTATAGGVDYTFTSPSTLTFAAGSSGATQNAILSLNDDALVEGTERIELGLNILGDTTGQVALGAGVTHSVLILDNDTAVIGFASTSSTVSEGTPNDTLALVLSITANGTGTAALAQEVTLSVTGGGGTAFGGGIDYTLPLLIRFPSGSLDGATQTADLRITDDALVENAETAILGLALFGDGTGQVRIANGAAGVHTTTITDNDTATVTLSGGLAHAEGQSGTTAYTFTATLDHAVQGGLSVAYLTNDGTATLDDLDYVDNDGSLIFVGAAGETQTITLLVNGDTQFENDETFIVTLDALSGAPAGVSVADAPQTGTITNDDPLPTISIADASVLEGDTGASFVVFTVSLTNASILPVTVDFATANGTAIAPGDYTAIPHDLLTFAPGETSKPVSVAIRSDTLFESGADETFIVQLSNPGNATLGDAQAVGTIINDESPPASTITLDAKTPYTFFDRNHDKVTVKLKGPGAATLILDGGALDNADISEINLTGTTNKSALSIAVKKDKGTGDGVVGIGEVTIDGALKSFSGKAADITVGGVRASGPVKAITTHALLAGEILTGGAATDKFALSLGALGDGSAPFLIATPQIIKSLKAVSVSPGEIEAAALGSIAVSAGPLAADVASVGAIAKITVKGGDLSGDLTAASFGKVTVKGGNFSGSLTSLTPGATLGKSKALTSLTVSEGNLTGDLRLLGASGAISVKSKRAPAAGSITGASIVASAIAKLSVERDFTESIVLAGADLGTDHAFGGGDDTFAAGTIGAVKIGGQVSGAGSIIGAGFSTTNSTVKDDDDTIIGGVASVIARLSITGAAAPESYFAAGLFETAPKIAGQAVSPAADLRFKIA